MGPIEGKKCLSESMFNNCLCHAHNSHLARLAVLGEALPTKLLFLLRESPQPLWTAEQTCLSGASTLPYPSLSHTHPGWDGTTAVSCLESSILPKEMSLCPACLGLKMKELAIHLSFLSSIYSLIHSFMYSIIKHFWAPPMCRARC